jgi:hypothetical protein
MIGVCAALATALVADANALGDWKAFGVNAGDEGTDAQVEKLQLALGVRPMIGVCAALATALVSKMSVCGRSVFSPNTLELNSVERALKTFRSCSSAPAICACPAYIPTSVSRE